MLKCKMFNLINAKLLIQNLCSIHSCAFQWIPVWMKTIIEGVPNRICLWVSNDFQMKTISHLHEFGLDDDFEGP
jgi:hypothetical protein